MRKILEFQQKNGLVADGVIGKKTLNAIKTKLNIKSDENLCMFLGQVAHETGNFSVDSENLNYSEDGLMKIFHKYFPTKESTVGYVRNPVKIANKVYANRGGNGSEGSGNGYLYRGRGSIQTTFASNYKSFSEFIGSKEIMIRPELVAELYFFESGMFYFNNNHLWDLCNEVTTKNITLLSKAINLGNRNSKSIPNGLKDRIEQTNKFKAILGI